jgi:NAD-dependent deacetylase
MRDEAQFQAIADRLDRAARVALISGSGMSAESGIPTFRDVQTGLWSRFRPEELATPEAFARNPAQVWQWYEHRRAGVRAAKPHAGHHALVRLEARVKSVTIITQNVDGLHQRSGSNRVLELHGNILRSVCSRSGRGIDSDWIANNPGNPPPSPYMRDAYARPDVVWFGETLPTTVLEAAIAALKACSVCLVAGTSAVVEPAASLPLLARQSGALLVEINPNPTPLSPQADICLRTAASAALGRIMQAVAARS